MTCGRKKVSATWSAASACKSFFREVFGKSASILFAAMIKLGERIRHFFVRQQDVDSDRDGRHAAWIQRMAAGDMDALSALYDETSPVLFGFARQILHERESAEEALVEIYECARREASRFEPGRMSPIDWLVTVARTVAVTRRQTAKSTPSPPFKHKRQIANAAVARLSDEQHAILDMTYLGGFTAGEVANVLELPVNYVKEQIVLAMQKLRAGSRRPALLPVGDRSLPEELGQSAILTKGFGQG